MKGYELRSRMEESNPYRSPSSPRQSVPTTVEKKRWLLFDLLIFGVGASVGFALWWFCEELFGENEPWDADTFLYPAILGITGFLGAVARPKWFWLAALGTYIGQVAFMSFSPDYAPMLILIPIAVAFFGFLPALIGTGAGWLVRFVFGRLARRRGWENHSRAG